MGVATKIQWTHHSWSPWRGCAKVSPGCQNCYAEKLSHRNPAVLGEWGPNGKRAINRDWQQLHRWNRAAEKAGERRRVFPSLCDPFEDREELVGWRTQFFAFIRETPWLDYLILTKRPENIRPMLKQQADLSEGRKVADVWGWLKWYVDWLNGKPPENVWLGVSVENQEYADERIPILLSIPARIRFLSVEPLLGPVDLLRAVPRGHHFSPRVGEVDHSLDGINWVIIGGESGHGARPCDLSWIRSIVGQCREAGIPCFVKQLGANVTQSRASWDIELHDKKGGSIEEWPYDLRIREYPS